MTTSTHEAWTQTRYAACLRQADQDAQRRVVAPPVITCDERTELASYVRWYACHGGYAHVLSRVTTTCDPDGLSGVEWGLMTEALERGIVQVGRGVGPVAARLDERGLLKRVRRGMWRLTASGKRMMEGS